ncbi:phosphotransferase family protein [Rhodococcus koreensis]|uniref:phosphotransferase family protein n=1 Tax=Rhodococcus koreensis TaxID=99653 RepID=UPI00366BE86F
MRHSVTSQVARVLQAELALVDTDPSRVIDLLTVGRALLRRAELDDDLVRRRAATPAPRGIEELLAVELPAVGEELDGAVVPIDFGTSTELTVTASDLVAALGDHPRGGRIVASVEDVRRLSGGFSKEMLMARAAYSDGSDERFVVRKVAPGRRADGLRAEYDVLSSAFRSGCPVPEPWWYDSDALGTPAIATSALSGAPAGDPNGWLAPPSSTVLASVARAAAQQHQIELEAIDSNPLPPLVSAEDRREALCERREVLDGLWADGDDAWSPAFHLVLDWLESAIPEQADPPVLVHGDFGPHNFLIEVEELSGILDWERSHAGLAVEDLAYLRPTLDDESWTAFMCEYVAAGGREPSDDALAWYIVWQDLWRAVSAYRMRSLFLRSPDQVLYGISGLLLAPRFLTRAVRSVSSAHAITGARAC